MDYVEMQLQPGEQIVLRANRGRQWQHYVLQFAFSCLLVPLMAGAILACGLYLIRIYSLLGAQDPTILRIVIPVLLVFAYALPLLILAAGLVDLIRFLVDELVLTSERIVGRTFGSFFRIRKINVPLSAVGAVRVRGTWLDIISHDGKALASVAKPRQRKEFAETFSRSQTRQTSI